MFTCGSTLMTHCAGRCEAIWVTISHGNDRRLVPLLEGEGLVSIALTDGSKLNLWGKTSECTSLKLNVCKHTELKKRHESLQSVIKHTVNYNILQWMLKQLLIQTSRVRSVGCRGRWSWVDWHQQGISASPRPPGRRLLSTSTESQEHTMMLTLLSVVHIYINQFIQNRLILHMFPRLPPSWIVINMATLCSS